MFYIIAFLLCGISFAPLFLQKLDIWHAQGIFVQMCLVIAFSWSFVQEKKPVLYKNVPLGLLHLWIGLQTAWICLQVQIIGQYDIKHFLLYFNFLCLLILYNIIVQYLDSLDIEKILNYLRYVIIATLITCVLQRVGISQFFELLIDRPGTPEIYNAHNNPVVGFLGNGTHLSGFLAGTIPIFLWHNKREDYLALWLMFLVLTQTGTTIGNPAISGFIVGLAAWVYLVKHNRFKIILTILLLLLLGTFIYRYLPENFFTASGRIPLWGYYLDIFKKMPITGYGLGFVNIIYKHTPFTDARHVHLEYLQYAVELGLIGLVLIVNMVYEFFLVEAEDKTELCLKACILAFLVSCFFNYPTKLWLPATWALFFYASIYAIKNEEKIYGTK